MYLIKGNDIPVLEDTPDKDGILFYTFYLKPPLWNSGEEYIKGDIVSPITPTGYIYEVINSGISGDTEPTWGTKTGEKTTDNTVIFRAVDNIAYLSSTGTLDILTAEFTATESVPIVSSSFTAEGKAIVKVGPVPSGVRSFILNLEFDADTGFATSEHDQRSLKIVVSER